MRNSLSRKALRFENDRIASKEFREKYPFFYGSYHYFRMGLYYEQVKRYMETFGRENVQVHIFEEFSKYPMETCKSLFSFLGVAPDFCPTLEKHNTASKIKVCIPSQFPSKSTFYNE